MPWFRSVTLCVSLTVAGGCALAGCRSTSTTHAAAISSSTRSVQIARSARIEPSRERSTSPDGVVSVSHAEPSHVEDPGDRDADDPFLHSEVLSLDVLIEQVQARNPSLAAIQAAWGAAAQKYPQAVALDDPMFQSMFAPQSFSGNSNVQSSYYLGIAQKVPWAGKRGLRGQQADWETSAASFDVGETSLRLSEAARIAFLEYYLNARLRELLDSNITAAEEFRSIAKAKYEANQVTQQDMLQADVELAQLEQRKIELSQEQQIVVARINTLLHRRPDHALPEPPDRLPDVAELPAATALRDVAVEQRPELQAMAARFQAEQTAAALACKEFYPDFEFMGRYDRFWTDREQRPQVGMNVNIPLNQSRRHAAVQERQFQVQKLHAELDQATDNIRNEVQAAWARVQGGIQTVRIYDTKILVAANENLAAARAGYSAGTVDFLRLIEAQRATIDLKEKHQMAVADLHRRWAELERAVGGPVAVTTDSNTIAVPAESPHPPAESSGGS